MNLPNPAIDREFWESVSSIFADALEIPAPQREPFLRDACRGSSSIEAEVRRLLLEHEQAGGSFLEGLRDEEVLTGDEGTANRVWRAGDTLNGRFRIIRLLGAGGMGEVYEARDGQLGQRIAIKTLCARFARDPAMVERFRAEVLRSRQITHSNVARVYDLFTHQESDGIEIPFFTMELLEGEPLSRWLEAHGPLSPEAALPLIQEMSAALHAAHSVGIVHRDFKPGNVFLSGTAGSTSKATVTDFGIAVQVGSLASPATVSPASSLGSLLVGTPAYMSPERLLGGASSCAEDVYALGLVVYEMLTGQRAYNTGTPLACALKKTVKDDPVLFEEGSKVPPHWIEAIQRAVRRDPEQRFADPLEFVAALTGDPVPVAPAARRTSATMWAAVALVIALASAAAFFALRTARDAHSYSASLAVLPFENTGADSQSAYLSDGVAEGLVRSLTAFPKLRVTPQTEAASYRDHRKPLPQIAKALGTDMLLTGSFHESAHHLHLAAELRDGAHDKLVWAQIYDCDMEQLLTVQEDITQQVAARLSLGVAQPKSTKQPTDNPEAYDLFLRARFLWGTRTRDGVMKAIEYFERAVALDPKFARAHAGIADAYIVLADYGWNSPLEVAPKAQAALKQALSLDEDSAETQASLGLFHALIDWDQPQAERAFQRALSLDPTLAPAHHWYANYLERSRRMDEALRQAQEARRLDPTTPPTLLIQGWIRYYRREYAAAIDIGKQAIEIYPGVPQGHDLLALSYAASGQKEIAVAESAEAVRLTTDPAVAKRRRAVVLSRIPGYEEEARRIATELEGISWDRQAAYLVTIYAALHDSERMYHWADRAIEIHDPYLLMANVDLPLDAYRSEVRFQQILHRLGY